MMLRSGVASCTQLGSHLCIIANASIRIVNIHELRHERRSAVAGGLSPACPCQTRQAATRVAQAHRHRHWLRRGHAIRAGTLSPPFGNGGAQLICGAYFDLWTRLE
eukprot:4349212-Prymnesium_polylepis.1